MTFSLANPGRMPPHGWQFKQAQTMWSVKTPKDIDFNGAVQQIKNHRLGNPQYGLPTSDAEIEQEIIMFTAARLNYDSAWVTPSDDEAWAFMTGGKAPVSGPAPSKSKGCSTCG